MNIKHFLNTDFTVELETQSNVILISGMTLFILGLFLIGGLLSNFFSFVVMPIIPFTVFLSGVILLVHTYRFWKKNGVGFILHLALGIFYISLGYLSFPSVTGLGLKLIITLTLIMAIIFMVIGIFRVTVSVYQRKHLTGWEGTTLNGIFNFLISVYIFERFSNLKEVATLLFTNHMIAHPTGAALATAFLVFNTFSVTGIDILLVGISLIMLSFTTSKKS